MDFFNASFWQGFVGNLFATIIGVVVGIPVAFWINKNVESKTEQEKKEKILSSLVAELEINQSTLNNWQNNKKDHWNKSLYGAQLVDETWISFSDGGEIQWIKDVLILALLSDAYGQIKTIRYLYEKYLTWDSSKQYSQVVTERDLWEAIERCQAMIADAIKTIEKYMETGVVD